MGLPAADDRAGPAAVGDRPSGRVHADEPVEAVVHRQVGIDQALEGVGAGRERHRVGRVDRGAPLRVGAGRVEAGAVRVDLDAHLQPDGLVGVPVRVHRALGFVDAVRKRGELGPGAPLGVLEQLLHRREDRVAAVPLDEREHAADAGGVRGHLGAEVARGLVLRADLGEDELEDVLHDRAALDQLDRRDDHALLEDLLERSDRGGRAAADVDVVREVRDVADQLALVMDGRDQADVVQVDAARVRVVRDEHVAGGEVLGAVLPHRLRHLLGHRAEVDRLREALGDRAQLRVEERAREVRARLDVRRVGAPLQRERHLVGRCDERVPDHLERDRVYRHPYTSRARSALTFPSRTSRATSSRSRSSGGP